MKYLLDTNAVSAVMKADPHFTARLRSLSPIDVAVPQPVWAELSYGIERLADSRRKRALEDALRLVRTELPTVPWTDDVSDAFGTIKASLEARGARIEDFDCAIAAHAVALRLVLVTANETHMARVSGLTIEDWSRRG
ncbi:MAG: PIN domain-containing protein [Myxococcaceae bacterium]